MIGLLVGVAGAAAGNAIERMSTREEATELLIQLKGGERRAVVQAKGGEVLVAGRCGDPDHHRWQGACGQSAQIIRNQVPTDFAPWLAYRV